MGLVFQARPTPFVDLLLGLPPQAPSAPTPAPDIETRARVKALAIQAADLERRRADQDIASAQFVHDSDAEADAFRRRYDATQRLFRLEQDAPSGFRVVT